jgi:hypothetical protein
VATIRLLCSSNSGHQDELLRTTGKNAGDLYVAVGLVCPKCDSTVGYSQLRDSPNAESIRSNFEFMMTEQGCPCCRPDVNFTQQI